MHMPKADLGVQMHGVDVPNIVVMHLSSEVGEERQKAHQLA